MRVIGLFVGLALAGCDWGPEREGARNPGHMGMWGGGGSMPHHDCDSRCGRSCDDFCAALERQDATCDRLSCDQTCDDWCLEVCDDRWESGWGGGGWGR